MSETITIKFPRDLREQAERKAEAELLTLSAYLRRLVAADVKYQQPAA